MPTPPSKRIRLAAQRIAVGAGAALLRLRRLPGRRRRSGSTRRLVFFFDLVQDLAVLEPFVDAARQRTDFAVSAWLTGSFKEALPTAAERLAALGIPVTVLSHKRILLGRAPGFGTVDALVTASESTASAHRVGFALTRLANAAGVETFTLQHGLENVGLSYFDSVHGSGIRFASRHVLTWSNPALLPEPAPAATRARCVAVGRPDPAAATPIAWLADDPRPLVCVFENVHWHRYPPPYRRAFFADLQTAAASHGGLRFLLRPHPAVRRRDPEHQALIDGLAGVTVADGAASRWHGVGVAEVLASAAAVVTTPSTVALDAACLDLPVAVARYGLDLPLYAPLPMLDAAADWDAFLDAVRRGSDATAAGQAFRVRSVLAGDAPARALDVIAQTLS